MDQTRLVAANSLWWNQDRFTSNKSNKDYAKTRTLYKQYRYYADVLIVETAMEMSISDTTITVGEDDYLDFLLVLRNMLQQDKYFRKPGKKFFF